MLVAAKLSFDPFLNLLKASKHRTCLWKKMEAKLVLATRENYVADIGVPAKNRSMPRLDEIIRNSSAVFAMYNMPRMCDDVLLCGRSPHFSAGNEICFITKVPTPKNILSDNKNLLILFNIKYVLKILTHRKYKKLSKRKNLVCKYAAKRT